MLAAALVACSGISNAMGMMSFTRDLTLASKMGISSEELWGGHKSAHEIAIERSDVTLNARYVSVWFVLVFCLALLTTTDSNRSQ